MGEITILDESCTHYGKLFHAADDYFDSETSIICPECEESHNIRFESGES